MAISNSRLPRITGFLLNVYFYSNRLDTLITTVRLRKVRTTLYERCCVVPNGVWDMSCLVALSASSPTSSRGGVEVVADLHKM